MMIHDNERQAFSQGAAIMRDMCAQSIQECAEDTERIGKECRTEADRNLLLIEAQTLYSQAALLRHLPLPEFRHQL